MRGGMSAVRAGQAQVDREEALIREQNGGHIDPVVLDQLNQQREQLGMQMTEFQQQYNYGWEARLMSSVVGAGENFALLHSRFSHRAAVRAGVRHPSMGSTEAGPSGYLREGMDIIRSIAGATGTPEGMAVSAMTGTPMRGSDVSHILNPSQGGTIRITGKVKLEKDGNLNFDGTTVEALQSGANILPRGADMSFFNNQVSRGPHQPF